MALNLSAPVIQGTTTELAQRLADYTPMPRQVVEDTMTGARYVGDGETKFPDLEPLSGGAPFPGLTAVQTMVRREFPLAFDTSNLDTGVTLYTPAAGELIVAWWVEISEVWDGDEVDVSFVRLDIALEGKTTINGGQIMLDADHGAVVAAADTHGFFNTVPSGFADMYGAIIADALPLNATVLLYDSDTQESLGAPPSTQGAFKAVFLTVPPVA